MKNKIRNIAVALIAVAVLVAGVPHVLAYFTDYVTAEGSVPINIVPVPRIEEEYADGKKTVTIKNDDEATEPCWVRLRAFGPEGMLTYTPGADWTTAPDTEGWYYYTKILEPGDAASEFVVSIDNVDPDKLDEYNVVIIYESVPVLYNADGSVPTVTEADWSLAIKGKGEK